jgi:hypothetical protein
MQRKNAGNKIITYLCDIIKQAIMPTIFIFFGLRFLFFSNDHEPIHVHVVKGQGTICENAVFQVLPEIQLLKNNGLKSNELKLSEMVIEENREIIIEHWNNFFNRKNNGSK